MKSSRIVVAAFVAAALSLVGCAGSRVDVQLPARKNDPKWNDKTYVLMVSIDGYRYDYTQWFAPPHLSEFQANSASAESLIPSFPSKTFPNHYTLVTGLYPENHGIVSNFFYDFSRDPSDTVYKLSDRKTVQDASWYAGTPLWVAAEQQGMLAGTYFWPGSEAAIQGVRPTYVKAYDGKVPNLERVQGVLEWLKLPVETRPHFLTLYFSSVDAAGHKYGTRSQELKEAVLEVDAVFGVLMKEIRKTKIPVNVIVVSDHGMRDLDARKVEYLDDYADLKDATVGEMGQQALIYVKQPEARDRIYAAIQKRLQHGKIYKRSDVPKRLHYSKNPRAGDLIVLADPSWSVGTHDPGFTIPKASHGYNPADLQMRGIFYAQGPTIKGPQKLHAFDNVHVYPFVLKLLGLSAPQSMDGRLEVLESIVR